MSNSVDSEHIFFKYAIPELKKKGFEYLGVLGSGSYGIVGLFKKRSKEFAIKAVNNYSIYTKAKHEAVTKGKTLSSAVNFRKLAHGISMNNILRESRRKRICKNIDNLYMSDTFISDRHLGSSKIPLYTYFKGEHFDSDLSKFLRKSIRHAELNTNDLKKIFYQVALGIRCLHRIGILHYDIKELNILINKETLNLKIIDYDGSGYNCNQKFKITCTEEEEILTTNKKNCNIDVNPKIPSRPKPCGLDARIYTKKYQPPKYDDERDTNVKTDIWSFGIIIINTLVRLNQMEIHSQVNTIFSSDYKYYKHTQLLEYIPKDINMLVINLRKTGFLSTQDAHDLSNLLLGMLEIYPEDRYSIHQVLQHRFFDSLNKSEFKSKSSSSSKNRNKQTKQSKQSKQSQKKVSGTTKKSNKKK
jgi:serine/threonine protein kinase